MQKEKAVLPAADKPLRTLLLVHALLTLAAGIVLAGLPAAIPRSVGIAVNKSQYLICYFLGAAELAVAYLSFASRNLKDRSALRVIITSFIIFHLATAI